ncbi:hypothetical protein GT347_01235 [Xylophilus rhododendri]|uniref:Uncharacterized protein n=1 Tax=Xylophilus rhododendri TaxID=2697032 RepID=A0A857IYT5_9BURK|nr:hypothetical protein [Xylophilus rhododendri]QHI96734.1 hypothetical protein GT347_01235 [Xylophilus rhododendri]
MEDQLLSSLSQMILGGVIAAAVAFWIFRWVGTQWMETSFAERVAIMAKEHQVLVGKLRQEMAAMLAEKKLQERDFAVLPGTWERLEKARSLWNFFVAPAKHQIDVKYLDLSELDRLMGDMEWYQSDMNRVKSLGGFARQKEFDAIRSNQHMRLVKDASREYEAYVNANAIYYPDDILAELKSLAAVFQSAVQEKEQAELHATQEVAAFPSVLDAAFDGRVDAMAGLLRKKLKSHEDAAAP